MNHWNIEILKDWDIIFSAANRKKWLDVLDKSPNSHVFFHPALVEAWVETYRPLRKMKPLFVWGISGDIQALFPLVRWKRNWKNAFQKMIVPMGYSDFDYHDPIFSKEVDPNQIQSFYSELFSHLGNYDSICLDGIHSGFIPEQFNVILEEPCPFINLSKFKNSDDYLNSLSKNVRKSYNRRKSNLESNSNISYCCYENIEDLNNLNESILLMMKYHSERWPNAYKAPGFHENLIKKGLNSGTLILYQIQTENDIVSWQIAFKYKEKLLLYMPTINPTYSSYSPGRLSLIFCIEDASKKGLNIIDQLRGSELYKSDWTSDYDTIYNVILENRGIFSQLKKMILKIKKMI